MTATGNKRLGRWGVVGFWTCIVATITALCATISNSSLWIDEGYIAWVVAHDTWLGLWQSTGSPFAPSPGDRQYPLYDAWLWCWTRIVSPDEKGLRAANIPFVAMYVVAIASTSKFAFKRSFAWVPFGLAPFVVYYVSEARPYLMLLAFSTVSIGAACTLAFGEGRARSIAARVLLPSFVLAWATHILAFLALPGIVAVVWYGLRKGRTAIDVPRRESILWAIAFLALGCYYATTLGSGAAHREFVNNNRGAGVVGSLGEILYEQLGFGGFGPPRDLLRSSPTLQSFGAYLPWLGLGALAYLTAAIAWLRRFERAEAKLLFAVWISPLLLVGAITFVTNARFLGRHLAEIFPFFVFLGIATPRNRLVSSVLACAFLISDARLITLPAYAKDDYRGAVAELSARASDRTSHIDWAADDLTAAYYRLAVRPTRNRGAVAVRWPETLRASNVGDLSPDVAIDIIARQRRTGPVYLAMSRTDYFDTERGIRSAIDRLHGERIFTTSSFAIFRFGAAPPRGSSTRSSLVESDGR